MAAPVMSFQTFVGLLSVVLVLGATLAMITVSLLKELEAKRAAERA